MTTSAADRSYTAVKGTTNSCLAPYCGSGRTQDRKGRGSECRATLAKSRHPQSAGPLILANRGTKSPKLGDDLIEEAWRHRTTKDQKLRIKQVLDAGQTHRQCGGATRCPSLDSRALRLATLGCKREFPAHGAERQILSEASSIAAVALRPVGIDDHVAYLASVAPIPTI